LLVSPDDVAEKALLLLLPMLLLLLVEKMLGVVLAQVARQQLGEPHWMCWGAGL
jgi:hypothetical protein